MKKTSLFFILIFSVFFGSKIAFAMTASNFSSNIPTAFFIDSDHYGFDCNPYSYTPSSWTTSDMHANRDFYFQVDSDTPILRASNMPICASYPYGYSYPWYDFWHNNSNNVQISSMLTVYDPSVNQATGHVIKFFWTQLSGDTADPFFQVDINGGLPITNTRIENIAPTDASTTGSTTVSVSADYYFADPDTANYLTPPLVLVARLHRTDAIGTADQHFDFTPLTFNALTSVSHTFTLPTNSTWSLRWDISGDGYYFVAPFSTPTSFNVVSDPSTGTTGTTTCSLTDIAGCFQNALVFLFYPSDTALSQYNGLYAQFIHKPPFGYIVAIQNALSGINDTATSAFTLQSLPILNTYIFDPVRLALAWVLWVAFAFVLYHRLKNIAI